eukprot:m.161636 g.161636  ORF g.161636 m.161636 type:complete len:77 (+) comp16378_c2_seq4:350-580(+)
MLRLTFYSDKCNSTNVASMLDVIPDTCMFDATASRWYRFRTSGTCQQNQVVTAEVSRRPPIRASPDAKMKGKVEQS